MNEAKTMSRRLFCGLSGCILCLAREQFTNRSWLNAIVNLKFGTLLRFSGDKDPLGFVVAMPQGCQAGRPGGSTAYGTPEWIKEIVYISQKEYDQNAVLHARQTLGPHRLGNDQYTSGCGHISKNVTVTDFTSEKETIYKRNNCDMFFSLIVRGSPTPDGDLYIADEVWISDKDMQNLPEYDAVTKRPLPLSVCPAPPKPPVQGGKKDAR